MSLSKLAITTAALLTASVAPFVIASTPNPQVTKNDDSNKKVTKTPVQISYVDRSSFLELKIKLYQAQLLLEQTSEYKTLQKYQQEMTSLSNELNKKCGEGYSVAADADDNLTCVNTSNVHSKMGPEGVEEKK